MTGTGNLLPSHKKWVDANEVLSKVTTLQSLEWETESHRDSVEFRTLDEEGKSIPGHKNTEQRQKDTKQYRVLLPRN